MIKWRVKEIAEEKGISPSQLSRLASVSYSTVRRIFDDPYCSINVGTWNKIASALDVPVTCLIEDVEEGAAE